MFRKRIYKLIVVLLIVLLCSISTGILLAAPVSVQALVADYITFMFDGSFRPLPEGYTVLMYENRTYVPARFVAEQLGASVFWDGAARTVRFNAAPCESCAALEKDKQEIKKELNEALDEINVLKQEITVLEQKLAKAEEQPDWNYQALPQWRNLRDYNMEVSVILDDGDYTRVYVTVENKQRIPLQLVQGKAVAVAGGNEYKTSDVPYHVLDERWYHNINENETKEGYIMLPVIPEGEKNILLTFTLLYNDAGQQTTEIEFAIRR